MLFNTKRPSWQNIMGIRGVWVFQDIHEMLVYIYICVCVCVCFNVNIYIYYIYVSNVQIYIYIYMDCGQTLLWFCSCVAACHDKCTLEMFD